MTKLFTGAFAVLLLALVAVAAYAKHETTKNAALEASVTSYEQAIKSGTEARARLVAEIDDREQLLADTQRKNRAISNELAATEKSLQQVFRDDPTAEQWRADLMPDDVYHIVRNEPGSPDTGSDPSAAADGVHGTDPRADPQRKTKRRLARLGAATAHGAASG
jgi:hypothetical protein